MRNPPNVEQVGPQARIQAELVRLESQKWEFWVLIIFAGVVLLLGVLSFFFPSQFWYEGGLHVSLSPQVLFVIMVATVLASLVLRPPGDRGARASAGQSPAVHVLAGGAGRQHDRRGDQRFHSRLPA